MGTAFYNDSHKRVKLNGTICLYKGEPYHVDARAGIGENMVRLTPISGTLREQANRRAADLIDVDYRDDNFNYMAPPLGYINWQGSAYYLGRLPDRGTTQGLSQYSLTVLSGENMEDSHGFFWSPSMRECILAIHPSYPTALDKLDEGDDSCAFDRHFAVRKLGRRGLALLSRGRVIGTKNSKELAYKLCSGKDSNHLAKVLATKGVVTEL